MLREQESSWIGIPQQVLIDWATDTRVPLRAWQRLQYLAMGFCDETGIATFRRGELAKLLYGGPDKNRNLTHHIETAVRYGVLDTDSCRSFLRVPKHVLRSAPPRAGYRKRVQQLRNPKGDCVDGKRFSRRKASLVNAS